MVFLDTVRASEAVQQMSSTVNEIKGNVDEIRDNVVGIKDDVGEIKCLCPFTYSPHRRYSG